MFFRYLVGEKGRDDVEETRYKAVVFDDMTSDGWRGEELKGKVFDRGFRFTVNEEVGIYNSVIDIRKMSS